LGGGEKEKKTIQQNAVNTEKKQKGKTRKTKIMKKNMKNTSHKRENHTHPIGR